MYEMRGMDVRTPEFAKDLDYEALLELVNAQVSSFDDDAGGPALPMTFVMGAPRSGTTLSYQILAATGAFAYPSNLAARFPASPAFGAALHQLVGPLMPPSDPAGRFTSRAGNTESWDGPHEFGYLWQRWFPFAEHHEPPAPGQPDSPDLTGLVAQLGAMERIAARPLLFKNGILVLCTPHFQAAFPTLQLVEIERPAVEVCASVLAMRERYTGSRSNWWSTRPADADQMAARSPEEQVAHQVLRCQRMLEAARGPDSLSFTYASVCANPREFAEAVLTTVGCADVSLDAVPVEFERSTPANTPQLAAIEKALDVVAAELDAHASSPTNPGFSG